MKAFLTPIFAYIVMILVGLGVMKPAPLEDVAKIESIERIETSEEIEAPHTSPFREVRAPLEPSSGSDPVVYHLGGKLCGIYNRTHSFSALINQARANGDAYIDRHFNKYRGRDSGPLMLCNDEGKELAYALIDEYEKIYTENGWKFDHPRLVTTSRENSLSAIKEGNKYDFPVVVEEIGYIDDPVNGAAIREFLRSAEGQKRVAQATLDATNKVGFHKVVIGAGHNGNRGTPGASFDGFTETDYAFKTFEQIWQLNAPAPVEVAEDSGELPYESDIAESTDDPAYTLPPVWGSAPASSAPDYMGSTSKAASEPKKRFKLFKNRRNQSSRSAPPNCKTCR